MTQRNITTPLVISAVSLVLAYFAYSYYISNRRKIIVIDNKNIELSDVPPTHDHNPPESKQVEVSQKDDNEGKQNFEIQKDEIKENISENTNNTGEVLNEEKRSSKLTLSSGIYETRGRRPTMEDKYFEDDDIAETYPELFGDRFPQPTAFYGIYDGHRGTRASEYLEENLHKNIVESEEFKNCDIEKALLKGFMKTDADLLEFSREHEKPFNDGSTAAVAFIIGNKLYSANCGDAEIVLARKNENDDAVQPIVLSKLHKPTDPEEKSRIMSEGGLVLSGRVGGTLAVARAFGDIDFKTPYEDDDIKMGVLVTAQPFVNCVDLIPGRDQFIIVGCDGVWERLTKENTVSFIAPKIHEQDLSELCEEFVNYALNSGSQDNISAIIIKLSWEQQQ